MSRPLGSSAPSRTRAELLEHLDHAQEFLPVGAAERLERLAPLPQPLLQPLDLAPGAIAARGSRPTGSDDTRSRPAPPRAPACARARSAPARESGASCSARMRRPRAVVPAVAIASRGTCRGGVAQKMRLITPALEPHHGAVRQQRVEEHAVAADRVHAAGSGPGSARPCGAPGPAARARPPPACARPAGRRGRVACRRASTSWRARR